MKLGQFDESVTKIGVRLSAILMRYSLSIY